MNATPYHLRKAEEFSLLETILWENGEFFLLEDHLSRLKKSARFFSFPIDLVSIMRRLADNSKEFTLENKYRLRLLVDNTGKAEMSSSILAPLPTSRSRGEWL